MREQLTKPYEQEVLREIRRHMFELSRLDMDKLPRPISARDAQIAQHIENAVRNLSLAIGALFAE